MRLSVITDEISTDLAYSLGVMKEYGCTGAELRVLWGTNIADLSDEQVDQARKALDEYGVEVVCLASPLFKCELGEESGELGRMHGATQRTAQDQLDVLARCTRLSRLFGTKYIRMFSYWKRGDLTAEIEDRIAEGIADAVKYAEDNDVVLLLENEHDCYIGTGSETARFLDRINSPALKAVWDPGNAFYAGGELPFPDGYHALRNHVVHVHVKDAEKLASGKKRFIVVGEGEVGYKEHFDALKADGYTGYISLETHYRPLGGTPEQGSRLCLQSINKLLSE